MCSTGQHRQSFLDTCYGWLYVNIPATIRQPVGHKEKVGSSQHKLSPTKLITQITNSNKYITHTFYKCKHVDLEH